MAKRILIVDDEPRYLRLLEANLRTEGYEVVTAQDGLQAVDVFSNQPIDLVLMDVMMPKLDGFGATQRIREFSNSPIIILTAKGDGTCTCCFAPCTTAKRGGTGTFLYA